ncbi:C-type lectin BfL-2-like [Paroedura picta]|uniref:C-type lectin BfL-2-like n=1 Tax=Paroedura picta TaxID=143630 RepID=UPI004055EC57
MTPTWRVSCLLLLLLVSLFLQCESRRRKSRCRTNDASCQKVCPPGWMFYSNNCYGFQQDPKSWSAAEISCQNIQEKTHLSSLMSQQELNEVAKYLSSFHQSSHVWIGLHDPRRTRNWQWVDRAILWFFPWNTNEPNNSSGKEFCVHLNADTRFEKMNDASCDLELPYICKYHV